MPPLAQLFHGLFAQAQIAGALRTQSFTRRAGGPVCQINFPWSYNETNEPNLVIWLMFVTCTPGPWSRPHLVPAALAPALPSFSLVAGPCFLLGGPTRSWWLASPCAPSCCSSCWAVCPAGPAVHTGQGHSTGVPGDFSTLLSLGTLPANLIPRLCQDFALAQQGQTARWGPFGVICHCLRCLMWF